MCQLLDLCVGEVSADNVRGCLPEIFKAPPMLHHNVTKLQRRRPCVPIDKYSNALKDLRLLICEVAVRLKLLM